MRSTSCRTYLIIALLAVLPFINGLTGDFVYDDTRLIVKNENLKDWSNLWRGFGKDYYASTADRITLGYYRPITVGITLIDYQLWGANPTGYHVTNLLFHAADSALLYGVAQYLLPPPYSLAAAAIFAVHPVHTETVTFISGRVDAIAAFFYLAALLLFLRWRDSGKPLAAPLYGASLFLFFCGLLSKEMAVTLPAAVALLLIIKQEKLKAVVSQTAPYIVVVLLYLALRYFALGDLTARPDFSLATPLFVRILTAVKIAAYYLYILVLPPAGLNMEPSMYLVKSPGEPLFLLSLTVLAGVKTGALLLRKKLPAVTFGVFWVLVSLLPVLNIIPIETLAAERFLYIPSAGFALAVAAGLAHISRANTGVRPYNWKHLWPVILIIAVYLPITVYRNTFWKDDVTLWTEKLKTEPAMPKAYDQIGSYYLRHGMVEEGITAFRRLLQLNPDHARAHYNVGVYLEKKGLYADAEAEYTRAIVADPSLAGAHYNLGLLYWKRGQREPAYQQWQETLRIEPWHEGARYWIQVR